MNLFKKKFFLFAILIARILFATTTLSSRSQIHSSASSNVLFVPSVYFSCQLQYSSALVLFDIFLFSPCSSPLLSSARALSIVMTVTLTLDLVVCSSPFPVVLLPEVVSCSFIWNIPFCLLRLPSCLWFSVYWADQLRLPVLKKWLYVGVLWGL